MSDSDPLRFAFWLRPDWSGGDNLRDPGTTPFWSRPPLPREPDAILGPVRPGGGRGALASATLDELRELAAAYAIQVRDDWGRTRLVGELFAAMRAGR